LRAVNAAVIPVRSTTGAKQRLGQRLDQSRREALALAMLDDMLAALVSSRALDLPAVVSSDPVLLERARSRGVLALDERQLQGRALGLNGAVAWAAEQLEQRGATRLLAIPGDVPLLRSSEIDELFELDSPRRSVVLVRSGSPGGTNGLLLSPPTVMHPRFEGESLAAHVNACEQERLPCTVLDLAGFALDLDRPEDIETLLDAAQDLQTTRLLRHWFAGDLRNSTAA
jgi:2-phospho-L-lactate guanylyltransferase